MLSKLKKPTPEADPALLAWHPDFRNHQRLPDTKVIRTSFLVNGLAVLVAAVLITGLAYRVYEWRQVSGQIAVWQLQIDTNKGPSDQAVALHKKFQTEATNVAAISGF